MRVLITSFFVLAHGTFAQTPNTASHAKLVAEALRAQTWRQGTVLTLEDTSGLKSSEKLALNVWLRYLRGGANTIGKPEFWQFGEPAAGGRTDIGHLMLFLDRVTGVQLSAKVASLQSLQDSSAATEILTEFSVPNIHGKPQLYARTKVRVINDAGRLVFQSQLSRDLRTATLHPLSDISYVIPDGVSFDSATAVQGNTFAKDVIRRFSLTPITMNPIVFYKAGSESKLQRALGFEFLDDSISGLTLRQPIVVLAGDSVQGEFYKHEIVHAVLAQSAQYLQLNSVLEEPFAGLIGGVRGRNWQAHACTELRQENVEIPNDPGELFNSKKSANTRSAQTRQFMYAHALLSVAQDAGGDPLLTELLFAAGEVVDIPAVRNFLARRQGVSVRAMNATWRQKIVSVSHSC